MKLQFVVQILLNAAVNPVIYLVYNRLYRQELGRLMFFWSTTNTFDCIAARRPTAGATRPRRFVGAVVNGRRCRVGVIEVGGAQAAPGHQRQPGHAGSSSCEAAAMAPGPAEAMVVAGAAGALPAVSSMVDMVPPTTALMFCRRASTTNDGDEFSPPPCKSQSVDVGTVSYRLQRQGLQTFDEAPSNTMLVAYSC